MSGQIRISGNVSILRGVDNDAVADDAAIGVGKLQHLHKVGTNFATAIGGTPATREEIVFVAKTAGTVRSFHCLLNDTGTSTDIDFDLKKNGTTMLSSVVNITHADSDGEVKDGTLSGTSFVADDIISIAMTVTSSTGAQGAYAWAEIDEAAG